ncbi:MAG: BamA/TamA family outer membrane protein [Prevotella sp.]|nr:BamA/TamA family outer membrane protein [Prevotella sp.]
MHSYFKSSVTCLLCKCAVSIFAISALWSCSPSKFLNDGEQLLSKVEIESDDKELKVQQFEPYIRQRANSKWFSLFKVPVATYSLSGRDSTKWINKVLRNIGEAPVVFDSAKAEATCGDLSLAMQGMGYMHAKASYATTVKKANRVAVKYVLHPGEPYYIGDVNIDIDDATVRRMMDDGELGTCLVKPGEQFSLNLLNAERKRITSILNNKGFYKFNKEFITFEADSFDVGANRVALLMRVHKYRPNNNSDEMPHKRYYINDVTYQNGDGGNIPLRGSVLADNTAIQRGGAYSASDLQRTYNNFARLSAVRYTNIRFTELPDTALLDCNIQVSMNKPNSISFKPEGTNTAGDLGAAGTLTYENRNIFHGSEVFSLQARAAFEAITGLEGYQNQDYEEYGLESKILFPRFLAPFLSRSFRRNSSAKSELAVSYNLQNRPEFHRRVFTSTWRYHWAEPQHHTSYRVDLVDLNYVYMPWVSAKFKEDYLDDVSNRNAIVRYNYEDLFIMKVGAGLTYNNGVDVLRLNVETGGNLLSGLSRLIGTHVNNYGQRTLFNIAFAQYAKFDFDYTHLVSFDEHNSLALHAGLGVAYPYGNSTILPFEKRYFSGGASSVRGWNVRELGPGKFKGTDGRIDFINQTGDMKLDLNMEFRTYLFWKFNGAFFVDAGNIWTLRSYADQPGGQFKLDEFYKQIAVAYGLGLRLNLDYFVMRFDFGMKAVNPAYTNSTEHFPIANPRLGRDFAFHFAVGLPF